MSVLNDIILLIRVFSYTTDTCIQLHYLYMYSGSTVPFTVTFGISCRKRNSATHIFIT